MSLYEASGEELKAFWEKHAQMKQELGTQVSVGNIQCLEPTTVNKNNLYRILITNPSKIQNMNPRPRKNQLTISPTGLK